MPICFIYLNGLLYYSANLFSCNSKKYCTLLFIWFRLQIKSNRIATHSTHLEHPFIINGSCVDICSTAICSSYVCFSITLTSSISMRIVFPKKLNQT